MAPPVQSLAIAQGFKGSFVLVPFFMMRRGALAVEAALSERCANKIQNRYAEKCSSADSGRGYLDHLFEALQDKVEQWGTCHVCGRKDVSQLTRASQSSASICYDVEPVDDM